MINKDLRSIAEDRMRKEETLSSESIEKLSLKEMNLIIHDLKVHQIELEMQNEELKRIQTELDIAKARYFDIYDLAPVGYLIISDKGLILESNLTAANMLGLAKTDLLNQRLSKYIYREDQDIYYLSSKKLFESLIPKEYELRLIKNDGAIFWGHMKVTAVKIEGLSTCRLILSDITDRKKIEDELKENRDRLMSAQTMAHIGSWELNLQTNTVWASKETFSIYGFEDASQYISAETIKAAVLPEYLEKTEAAFRNLINQNSRYDEEFKIRNYRTGEEQFIHSIAVMEVDSEGLGVKVIGTAQDITERKRIQESLLEKETNMRAITDAANDAIIVLDQNGNITFWNPSAENILGYSFSEVKGQNLHMLIAPVNYHEVYQHAFPLFQQSGKGNAIGKTLDVEAVKKDKTKIPVQLSLSAMHMGTGWFSVGIIRDITERKQMERELMNSRERQAAIFNQSPVAIEIYNSDGCLINVNDSCLKLFGVINPDELKGFSLFDDPNISDEIKQQLQKHERVKIETKFDFEKVKQFGLYATFKSGVIDIEMFISTLLYDQKPEGYIVQIQDVTEQKQAKEKVLHLSYHDQLTGLYNRRYYDREMKRFDDEKFIPLTLIMADVNGLKLTNDAFGHGLGDELLIKVAGILKATCRTEDIVFRIGGDEFVILLPETDAENAEIIINRINAAIKNEKIDNIILSVSMGYAVKQNNSDNMNEIFMQAEDDMYRHKLTESKNMRSRSVDLIMNSLFERNSREKLHSQKVGEICKAIAEKLGFASDEVNELSAAGLMHDIGKIGITETILNKPAKLNAGEWNEIERHSEIGYRILGSVNEFSRIAKYVLEHHEKWDGTGYPKKLKGEEISQQARIIAVADSYDAMTTDRSYRKGLSEDEAATEISKCSGTQFDPEIVKVFIEIVLGKAVN